MSALQIAFLSVMGVISVPVVVLGVVMVVDQIDLAKFEKGRDDLYKKRKRGASGK